MMRIHILKSITVLLTCITIGSNFGQLHFALDTLSHFKVQYAILYVLFAASFAILRRPVWLALSLVGITANLASIIPWYITENDRLAAESDNSIKILTSNVYMRSKDYQSLLDLVDEEQPEILGLLEVDARWLDALSSLRNEYKFRFEYPSDDTHGLALFSKFPISKSEIVLFGESSTPAIVAEIVADKDIFELILAHPPPPMSADLAESRNLQLQQMAQHVRASDKTVVLAGDLNTTMWSPHYDEFVKESGLMNARAGYGIGATWVIESPFRIPIDHIMISRPSRASDFQVHKRIGSDHRPISARVTIIPHNDSGVGNATLAH